MIPHLQCRIYPKLTLKTARKPASENVANFSNLFLNTGKQCGPRSDCSFRSSLIWVPTVCRNDFQNHKQMTKQMTMVVIGSLRVKVRRIVIKHSGPSCSKLTTSLKFTSSDKKYAEMFC